MKNTTSTAGVRTLIAVTSAFAISGAFAFSSACSSSSSVGTGGSGTGTGVGTGTGTGHGSSGSGSSTGTGTGTGTGAGSSTGTGTGTGAGTTLYERLGGHAGIRTAVNAVVAAELANADLASYFFYQTDHADGGAPVLGHPTGAQIEECFTFLVGHAAGGPEVYPVTLTADAGVGVYTCRDLTTAHRDLKINAGTFNEFITIAGGVLTTAGVASTDLETLAAALIGTEPAITSIDAGPATNTDAEPFPGSVDAALKLDSTY